MNIYEVLNRLDIKYDEVEHKAVFTAKEASDEHISDLINGIECKNLFLKYKDSYYLVFLTADKKADLKYLAKKVNKQKLSFASIDELKEILNLDIGSVTPLGIIYDDDIKVKLVIDKDLVDNKVLMHTDSNSKTISIYFDDLVKIIHETNHEYILF